MIDDCEHQSSTLTAMECHGSVDSAKSELVCSSINMGSERVPQHNANEAGMRLSLRITSWNEAGARMRSRVTSWSGKTCTAGTDSALRRVCPGRGNFGESHGCRSFRTAPSVEHRIAWVDKADKNSRSPETYDAMRKTTEREAKDQITKQINKYARKGGRRYRQDLTVSEERPKVVISTRNVRRR